MKADRLKKLKLKLILSIVSPILIISLIIFSLSPTGKSFIKSFYLNFELEDFRGYSENYDYSVTFFDVETSDCSLIKIKDEYVLVDTSDPLNADYIKLTLKSANVDHLEAIFISHFDTDHSGSLLSIIEEIGVDCVYFPSFSNPYNRNFIKIKEFLDEHSIKYKFLSSGDKIKIGESEFLIHGPVNEYSSTNENSLVFTFKANDFKVLFTGDMEQKELSDILNLDVNLDCDVLKVSHHGSINGISEEFLIKTSPEFSVISVGTNSSGLPNQDTIELLKESGTEILRTDAKGIITIASNTNDTNIYLKTFK